MANKTIYDYSQANTIDSASHWLLIQPGNNSVDYKRINKQTLLSITGDPVGTTDTQTIANKTINNSNTVTLRSDRFTLQDSSDVTKQAVFNLSSITASTTRSFTLPNGNTTLVGADSTQTLTNKTIDGSQLVNSSVTANKLGDTGWVLLNVVSPFTSPSADMPPSIRRIGNTVYVRGWVSRPTGFSTSATQICTMIPVEFRPAPGTTIALSVISGTTSANSFDLSISSSGSLTVKMLSANSSWMGLGGSWIVE
jgi:hypothetical protein